MLVIVGELKVKMEPSNSNCHHYCMVFKQHPILQPGDICELDLV